ncbi:hypothetical protein DFR65_104178 [Oceanihabitans sediminis]|nr:hypothetical protein DFR65_104178 [Oceanihabitans sediminis]
MLAFLNLYYVIYRANLRKNALTRHSPLKKIGLKMKNIIFNPISQKHFLLKKISIPYI